MIKLKNILISSRSFSKYNKTALNDIKVAGYSFIFNSYDQKLTENKIISLLDENTVGILAGTEKITRKVMQSAPALKVISRYGVGMDSVDLIAAKELGIKVVNTPHAPTQAVAELALALILNSYRKISIADRCVRSETWSAHLGNLLYRKTIGIVGLGKIGKTLVRLLAPFNVNILAYDPCPDKKFAERHSVTLCHLNQLLETSDVVTLHTPLTNDTHHLISHNELELMKSTAMLINTARGPLVNEEALIYALENNKIASAALDVFESEPYSGELRKFDNIILTPHIGCCAKETREIMGNEAVENLLTILKNETINI